MHPHVDTGEAERHQCSDSVNYLQMQHVTPLDTTTARTSVYREYRLFSLSYRLL